MTIKITCLYQDLYFKNPLTGFKQQEDGKEGTFLILENDIAAVEMTYL